MGGGTTSQDDEADDDGLSTTTRECLYPVPILNKGAKDVAGERVNKNDGQGDNDVFTRRFAPFDAHMTSAQHRQERVRFFRSVFDTECVGDESRGSRECVYDRESCGKNRP